MRGVWGNAVVPRARGPMRRPPLREPNLPHLRRVRLTCGEAGADDMPNHLAAVAARRPVGAEVVGEFVLLPVGEQLAPGEDVAVGVVGVLGGRGPRADEDLEDGVEPAILGPC